MTSLVKSDVGMDADVTGAKIAGWIFRADFLKETYGLKTGNTIFEVYPVEFQKKLTCIVEEGPSIHTNAIFSNRLFLFLRDLDSAQITMSILFSCFLFYGEPLCTRIVTLFSRKTIPSSCAFAIRFAEK